MCFLSSRQEELKILQKMQLKSKLMKNKICCQEFLVCSMGHQLLKLRKKKNKKPKSQIKGKNIEKRNNQKAPLNKFYKWTNLLTVSKWESKVDKKNQITQTKHLNFCLAATSNPIYNWSEKAETTTKNQEWNNYRTFSLTLTSFPKRNGCQNRRMSIRKSSEKNDLHLSQYHHIIIKII